MRGAAPCRTYLANKNIPAMRATPAPATTMNTSSQSCVCFHFLCLMNRFSRDRSVRRREGGLRERILLTFRQDESGSATQTPAQLSSLGRDTVKFSNGAYWTRTSDLHIGHGQLLRCRRRSALPSELRPQKA